MLERLKHWGERSVDFLCNLKTYHHSGALPKLIAHRGVWDESLLENTMPAFVKANDLGIWGIELDIRFTKDGVPVVHHDVNLQRLFGRPNDIASLTLQDLRSFTDVVPLLADVLTISNLHFMIEIKHRLSQPNIECLISLLNDKTPGLDFHFLTLNEDLIFQNSFFPPAAWVLVGELNLQALAASCLRHGYAGVAGHYLAATRSLIDKLHANKRKIGVGFIPTKNLLNREAIRNVDWVFTNSAKRLSKEQEGN